MIPPNPIKFQIFIYHTHTLNFKVHFMVKKTLFFLSSVFRFNNIKMWENINLIPPSPKKISILELWVTVFPSPYIYPHFPVQYLFNICVKEMTREKKKYLIENLGVCQYKSLFVLIAQFNAIGENFKIILLN